MLISEILSSGRKPFPSIEIVPPLKGVTKEELLRSIEPFMKFNPPYINVTSHRDEVEYEALPDGSFRRKVVARRVSETAVCAAIAAKFPTVEAVPHVICAGASKGRIENLFNDFKFLGISNIMALRGDSLAGEKRFTAESDGYSYASELTQAAKEFSAQSRHPLCVGVGAYPEKHFEAPNLETDVENLKKKVDAGADFIITQMFFDNEKFYRFRELCARKGITIPIIPGLKPLSTLRQISLIPESFSLDIPKALVDRMSSASDTAGIYKEGLEWCSAQCEDLLENGVPAVHFYTMGKPDNVVEILKRFFMQMV